MSDSNNPPANSSDMEDAGPDRQNTADRPDQHPDEESDGVLSWVDEWPRWLRKLIDPVAILSLGAAFLYLLGAMHYYAYFRTLGLQEEEILLSVPAFMTRGALISPLPFLLISVLVYEGLREEDKHKWFIPISNAVAGALLAFLAVVLAWLAPRAVVLGVIPAPPNLLSMLWLGVAAAAAIGTAVLGLFNKSVVKILTRHRLGRASGAAIAVIVLLVVANLHGALTANGLMEGDSGKIAVVEFEDGTEAPWDDRGRLYHILTHDSRFYFIQVWKTERGTWHEAIHIVPQEDVQALSLVEIQGSP